MTGIIRRESKSPMRTWRKSTYDAMPFMANGTMRSCLTLEPLFLNRLLGPPFDSSAPTESNAGLQILAGQIDEKTPRVIVTDGVFGFPLRPKEGLAAAVGEPQ